MKLFFTKNKNQTDIENL